MMMPETDLDAGPEDPEYNPGKGTACKRADSDDKQDDQGSDSDNRPIAIVSSKFYWSEPPKACSY